jgi:hypothetical protein
MYWKRLTVLSQTETMQDHIRDSLNRFEYSPQLRETAVFRILFDGRELNQVVTDLGIHSSYIAGSGPLLLGKANCGGQLRPIGALA